MKINHVIFILISLLITLISFNNSAHASGEDATSASYEVLLLSPSNYEINNASALYSGAINSYSPEGKKFAKEHGQISSNIIEDIETLGLKLKATRTLNKSFDDNIIRQFALWKENSDYSQGIKFVFEKETQVFNICLSYKVQENAHWAIIDSINDEIDKINIKDKSPVNLSLTKSELYNSLLISYLDLIDFYKDKYKYLIPIATLNHAIEENVQLNLPDHVISQIKPFHQQEMKIVRVLLFDLDDSFKMVNQISIKAKELNELYQQINNYSLDELTKIINDLQKQEQILINQANNSKNTEDKILKTNLIPVIQNYIGFYKALKEELKAKKLSYEITEASLAALVKTKSEMIACTSSIPYELLYTQSSNWSGGLYDSLRRGTSAVAGSSYALADYSTRRASDLAFEYTDKGRAAWNHGLFSQEYNNFSQAYDEAGERIPTLTLRNTFSIPLNHTLSGDMRQGIGQAAMRRANESFETVENTATRYTGSRLVTNAVLNAATVAAYGLGNDFTTLNNESKPPNERAAAAAGVVLNVVPVINTGGVARAAGPGLRNSASNLMTSARNSIDDVGAALNRAGNTNTALNNAVDNLNDAYRQAGQALRNSNATNAPGMVDDAFLAAGENLDHAIRGLNAAASANQAARSELNQTITRNVQQMANNTFQETVATGGQTIKNFVQEHSGTAIKDRFQQAANQSLREVANSSGGTTGYLLDSVINQGTQYEVQERIKNSLASTSEPAQNQPAGANNTPTYYGPQNQPAGANNTPTYYGPQNQPADANNTPTYYGPQNQLAGANNTPTYYGPQNQPADANNTPTYYGPQNQPADANNTPTYYGPQNQPAGANNTPTYYGPQNQPAGANNTPTYYGPQNQPAGANNTLTYYGPQNQPAGANNTPTYYGPQNQPAGANNTPTYYGPQNQPAGANNTLTYYGPQNQPYVTGLPSNNVPIQFYPANANNGFIGSSNQASGFQVPLVNMYQNQSQQNLLPGQSQPQGNNPYPVLQAPQNSYDFDLSMRMIKPNNNLNDIFQPDPPHPPYIDWNMMDQYLQSQRNQNQNQNRLNDLTNTITSIQSANQQFNSSRGSQGAGYNNPADQQGFNTDVNNGQQGSGNLLTHVQQLSQQTAVTPKPPQNQNNPPPPPQNNQTASNNTTSANDIPGYGGNTEPTYDGLDDDNDGIIDEGFANGSCQIIIHDTGGDKDDQWSLSVDGNGMGSNTAGKTRNWDLTLSKGQHNITFTGIQIPDNVGTYTVVFQKAQVVSGPPLTGRNLNQGNSFTWVINVQ
ncbi:MAG: hypothetical protein AB1782_16055 [Cyanobacteriota bacterium]